MDIRIVKTNGGYEVRPWNPDVSRNDNVVWKTDLKDVTVFFPYGKGRPHAMKVDKDGKNAKTGLLERHLNLKAKQLAAPEIEYPYAVFVDEGPGKRTFVHHSDPKIIVK